MNWDHPHRRYNPLTGDWLLVSPHRAKRPWLGQMEKKAAQSLPEYDPECYLCPGNMRNVGVANPKYSNTYVFENDFPALLADDSNAEESGETHSLFKAEQEKGVCKVVCFSPRHDLTMPELPLDALVHVIKTWRDETASLKAAGMQYVQVFENKGAMMGCSMPHPHSQIWSTAHIPTEPAKELKMQHQYQAEHGTCLLCDYLAEEHKRRERIVLENDVVTVVVPFWATWPFETMLLFNRHVGSLMDLSDIELHGLADGLKKLTAKYDNIFEISFPYSMGFHQTPFDGLEHPEWHMHMHFYPPLLRSATVRKFMVGYEMLAMPQRDLTAEKAAERLRDLSDLHYKSRE